jgi:hypothetical protein
MIKTYYCTFFRDVISRLSSLSVIEVISDEQFIGYCWVCERNLRWLESKNIADALCTQLSTSELKIIEITNNKLLMSLVHFTINFNLNVYFG